jgi:hypothetical protein
MPHPWPSFNMKMPAQTSLDLCNFLCKEDFLATTDTIQKLLKRRLNAGVNYC